MIQADTLKPGWKLVKFGDVVRQVKDKVDPKKSGLERYIAGEHMNTDDLRIRRWGEINDDYLGPAFHMRFKPGQVLYGSRRTYLRKVAVPDFEGICANTTFVLESKDPNVLLPELLPFIMQTEAFNEHSIKQSKGSVNPYVNFSDLEWWRFALPPIDEQKSFINFFNSIEHTFLSINYLANTILNLNQSYIITELSLIIQNTPNIFLDEIADIQYGLTINPKRRKAISSIPYLRVANVKRGSFDLNELKYTGKLDGDETFLLHQGDVLIVEGHADPNEIGRASVWLENETEMFHQNHLIRVRCESILMPEYLCFFINSKFGRKYFKSCAKSTSGLSSINSTVVKQLKIPVPTIKKQQEIVEISREYQKAYNSTLNRYNELKIIKQSVLAKLETTDVQRI